MDHDHFDALSRLVGTRRAALAAVVGVVLLGQADDALAGRHHKNKKQKRRRRRHKHHSHAKTGTQRLKEICGFFAGECKETANGLKVSCVSPPISTCQFACNSYQECRNAFPDLDVMCHKDHCGFDCCDAESCLTADGCPHSGMCCQGLCCFKGQTCDFFLGCQY